MIVENLRTFFLNPKPLLVPFGNTDSKKKNSGGGGGRRQFFSKHIFSFAVFTHTYFHLGDGHSHAQLERAPTHPTPATQELLSILHPATCIEIRRTREALLRHET